MRQLKDATIITAMVTPFHEDGRINFSKVPELVEYLLANGTNGLVVAGTTGESPTLTHEEELALFQAVIDVVAGRVPIIAGIGTNDTQDSIDFIREVAKLDGICCGLAVVPYYNKPSQEGLYRHFKAISEASCLPIMLYNVPGRTVASLDVETSLRLANLPNVVAIKECAGLDAISQLIEHAPNDFLVYTGEDGLAFSTKALGGQGLISVVSHICGLEISEMFQAIDTGNITHAASIARKLTPKVNAVFSVASPAPIKAILNEKGLNVGGLRLPLVACTEEEKATILKMIK